MNDIFQIWHCQKDFTAFRRVLHLYRVLHKKSADMDRKYAEFDSKHGPLFQVSETFKNLVKNFELWSFLQKVSFSELET